MTHEQSAARFRGSRALQAFGITPELSVAESEQGSDPIRSRVREPWSALPDHAWSGYVLQHITPLYVLRPVMCCRRLALRVSPAQRGLGDEAQNIIDRARSSSRALLSEMRRDPAAWKRPMQCLSSGGDSLRGGGFDQMEPDRGDCMAAAAWVGISDTTDTPSSSAGADYVLQLDQRLGAEQGEHRALGALHNITVRRT